MSAQSITLPEAASTVHVDVQPQQQLSFQFDPETATFERVENDLVILSEGGGKIQLDNFFVAGEAKTLPTLALADGTQISAEDFLAQVNPGMDLTTAAGPSSSSSGSGAGDYGDDPGALINGLDRLGSLGTTTWSNARETSGLTLLLGDGDDSGGPGEVGGSIPGGEGGESMPGGESGGSTPGDEGGGSTPGGEGGGNSAYHTRLVVTSSANGASTFRAVDENGNLVTDPSRISAALDNSKGWFNDPVIDPVTGEITISLTAAGLQALEDGVRFDDILTVTVDGKEYPMHLVGSETGGDYDYVSTEAATNLPGPLQAEWYTSDKEPVNNAAIHLGGAVYNQVDVSRSEDTWSYGARNTDIAVNSEARGVVNVFAHSNNGASYAVLTHANKEDGSSSIRAGKDSAITIKASSDASAAFGIYAYGTADAQGVMHHTETTVEGGDIHFETKSTESTSAGIYTQANANVSVKAEGTLSFDAQSTGGDVSFQAAGVYAREHSSVSLQGRDITVNAHAAEGGGNDGATRAFGFYTGPGSEIQIETAAEGKLTVNVTQDVSPYDTPYGGVAWSTPGAKAGFTSVGLVASGNVGQHGGGYGSVFHVKAGDIDIHAAVAMTSQKGTATAVYAGFGGDMTIDGANGRDNTMNFSSSAPSWAAGIFSTNYGTFTLNSGNGNDLVNISTTTKDGAVSMGMGAQAGSKTVLDGGSGDDTLNVTAKFTGKSSTRGTDYLDVEEGAFGMAAAWGNANNTVRGFETVNITADASESTEGWAFGMLTRDGWGYGVQNTVESSDGAITVTITAKAGSLGQAFSMYNNGGGINTIRGGSRAGDEQGDVVSLEGSIHSWGGLNQIITGDGNDSVTVNGDMTTSGTYGANTINTGNGEDTVRVHGNITSNDFASEGNTTINTGDGNDVIHLDGTVRGLHLEAGDGYDTLVLTASDYTEFVSRYGQWLEDNFATMHVEAVHVDFGAGANAGDVSQMQGYFSDPVFGGTNITYSYGDTLNMSGYMNDGGASDFNLADILDTIDRDDFNVVELAGGKNNHVTIDDLLDPSIDGLKINGDGNDSITLQGNWQTDGANNGGYVTYTNGDYSVQIHEDMLTNLNIMTNTGG